MLIDFLIDMMVGFVQKLLGLFSIFIFPESSDLMFVLIDILKFGSWVIGPDMLVMAFGVISISISMKISFGFAEFIYRHIPFIG